jgi:hypothetical protein
MQRVEQAAHMTWVIGDAEFQADDGGDARPGPQLATKAIGDGPSLQQRGQASELVGGQPPRGPRWRPATERLGAGFAGPFHPLADGSLADPHGLGNLAL